MSIKKLATALILSGVWFNAAADIWGVEDAALIAKAVEQLKELKNQLQVAKDTYAKVQAQYESAEKQLASVNKLKDFNTGHAGFGDLKNKLKDLENLKWSPDKWRDALEGKGSNSEYAKLLADYKKYHPDVVSGVKKSSVFDENSLAEMEQTAKITQAAGVQSEYAYNDINKSIERIHELSAQIEKANSTKQALDLNSRLIAELAYLQTQNIKAQTLANQQLSQRQSLEISRGAKASQFLVDPDSEQ